VVTGSIPLTKPNRGLHYITPNGEEYDPAPFPGGNKVPVIERVPESFARWSRLTRGWMEVPSRCDGSRTHCRRGRRTHLEFAFPVESQTSSAH
jgi:hypothetical protein